MLFIGELSRQKRPIKGRKFLLFIWMVATFISLNQASFFVSYFSIVDGFFKKYVTV